MEVYMARSFDASPDPESFPDENANADRRGHYRNIKVMRVARLKDIRLHAECLGMVRDVSSGGMKIDAVFPMEIGQQISVALLDDQELTGEVVWSEGKTVGVKFAEEIAVEKILARPAVKIDGRRTRLPRFQASKPSRITYDGQVYEAILANISQRGAKLLCEAMPRMNSNIVIRIDANHSVAATVKWRGAQMIGVEFHRLLPLPELANWLSSE